MTASKCEGFRFRKVGLLDKANRRIVFVQYVFNLRLQIVESFFAHMH